MSQKAKPPLVDEYVQTDLIDDVSSHTQSQVILAENLSVLALRRSLAKSVTKDQSPWLQYKLDFSSVGGEERKKYLHYSDSGPHLYYHVHKVKVIVHPGHLQVISVGISN